MPPAPGQRDGIERVAESSAVPTDTVGGKQIEAGALLTDDPAPGTAGRQLQGTAGTREALGPFVAIGRSLEVARVADDHPEPVGPGDVPQFAQGRNRGKRTSGWIRRIDMVKIDKPCFMTVRCDGEQGALETERPVGGTPLSPWARSGGCVGQRC